GPWLGRFLLAGAHIGTASLSHAFTYHVFLIPALIFLGIAIHLYLVIYHGISDPPRAGTVVDEAQEIPRYTRLIEQKGVPFWPDAAWRDAIFACAVLVLILGLAFIVGPKPLGKPPDPSIIDAEPRPDWYLLWYFALLAELPHGTERFLMWLLPLAAAVVLIFLPVVFGRGERHVRRRPWALPIVAAIVFGVGVFWRLGIRAPWSPDFTAPALPGDVVHSSDTLVVQGAALFHTHGCENCHAVSGYGGHRGPDLTTVGGRMSAGEIAQWIANGGYNMPAFSRVLTSVQLAALQAFLASRTRPTGGETVQGHP
ncbi:MAG TPA: cytochrome b N-terminal domain-containing protein, partial [Gemmatimonadaceae bacterium]|nr:cytochrome b N-terminal domain-containing protein [Gemmatimonadaceae bacterium]